MIVETVKNLFDSKAEILAYQADCHGYMDSDVSGAIRHKMLSTYQYIAFRDMCSDTPKEKLLGNVQLVLTGKGKYIANLFSGYRTVENEMKTDYEALEKALIKLEALCREKDIYHVAIPGYLGCEKEQDNWNKVYFKLQDCFLFSPVVLEICYLQENIKMLKQEMASIPLDIKERIEEQWHGFLTGTKYKAVKGYINSIEL